MTLALEWTKQEEFRSQPLTEWTVDGQVAGVTRSGGGLTYATISGAGHMVRKACSMLVTLAYVGTGTIRQACRVARAGQPLACWRDAIKHSFNVVLSVYKYMYRSLAMLCCGEEPRLPPSLHPRHADILS